MVGLELHVHIDIACMAKDILIEHKEVTIKCEEMDEGHGH
jgi:hypothetical protein